MNEALALLLHIQIQYCANQ